ncbi:hypothetical protein [Clostridium sp. YIM B02551]|uniref:hypothetical protein n=1 Tax=Clostridium sp. YIM B02551 TaxID=2910679 RepID=UPI001EEA41A9|nr:hypothetical protein [Clostridium sp. YIM B02551]
MNNERKAKLILFIAQSVVAIIACCIIIFLGAYRKDNTYFYLLIPIFIFNAISIFIYFIDNKKNEVR